MPGGVPGSSGVRHFGGGPPACRCYFAESPALPCHLHPRWTLTVAPPPSLSSSLTPSSPASFSLSCQASAWPAVAVVELDKAPASPARERPPTLGAPSGGKAASSPGPGRSLSGVGAGSCAWPQELPGLCQALPALCTLRSLSAMLHTAVLTWSRLPGLPRPRCLSSGRRGPFRHDSRGVGGRFDSVSQAHLGGDGTPSSEVLLEALHPYTGVSYSSSACPTAP